MRTSKIIFLIFILGLFSCKSKGGDNESTTIEVNDSKEKSVKTTNSNLHKVISEPDYFSYSTINGHTFKRKNEKALWDNKSIELDLFYGLVWKNNTAYITERNDSVFSFYEIKNDGSLSKKGNFKADFIYVTHFGYYLIKDNILFTINPDNQKLTQVYDFSEKLTVEDDFKSNINTINELSDRFIQVEFCRYHSGCYDFDSYIIDLKDNTLIYDNEFKKNEPNNDMFKACFFLANNDKDFFVYFYSSKIYSIDNGFICNDKFDIIDTTPNRDDNITFQCAHCEYGTYIAGLNIVNNELSNMYLGVYYYDNNQRTKYFLPYNFNPTFDKIISKLYKSDKISDTELNMLNPEQKRLAKNFIYAKYNYKFNTDYYQAYFSTYRFYNTEEYINSRTKEVNNKLTDNDRFNIGKLK